MKIEACYLCPRHCGAPRELESGQGVCAMGALPLIARAAPHFWEEPCISGDKGSGTIFFSGCTLRCAYCQNGAISHHPRGKHYTPRELTTLYKQLEDQGVHNINFVTPTHFTQAIIESLNIYKPRVPILWNTSGYETLNTIKMLAPYVNIYLTDLKHYSASMGALCANAPDYFAKASQAVIKMCEQAGPPVYQNNILQKGVIIRHLILPGLTSESIKILNFIKNNMPEGTPVSLMRQYVPLNGVSIKGLNRKTTDSEYRRVRDHMLYLDLPGYVQAKASADGAYVPPFE